jgi:hypothetical protein
MFLAGLVDVALAAQVAVKVVEGQLVDVFPRQIHAQVMIFAFLHHADEPGRVIIIGMRDREIIDDVGVPVCGEVSNDRAAKKGALPLRGDNAVTVTAYRRIRCDSGGNCPRRPHRVLLY